MQRNGYNEVRYIGGNYVHWITGGQLTKICYFYTYSKYELLSKIVTFVSSR